MKHVSILIPRGHTSMVNISGSHQMLNWVNEFFIQSGRKPLFTIQLVGLEKQTKQTHGLFIVNPEILIDQVSKTDLIIIPAIHGDFNQNLKINSPFLPWIIDQHNHGAEVVSLCVASFFLAETGLLDGRQCSTHWQLDRNSQSPFMVFSGQKSHQDKEILKAQEHIEKHFNEKLVVNELCKELAISRRTFERRFKKATGNTVVEYHQRVKVEAAKRALETGRKHINEVMYDVGYNDPKAFRDVFRKITDMTPLNYMTKYSKQAI